MQCCKSLVRGFQSSAVRNGKHNIRKFPTYGAQGSKAFRKKIADGQLPQFQNRMSRGVRKPYLEENGKQVFVAEMVPELIVPDLIECHIKPYVSYRAPSIEKSEFTSQDLFHAVFSTKIAKDYKEGNLNGDGSPKESSEEEKMSAEDAKLKVQQTGSDYVWKNLEDPLQFTV